MHATKALGSPVDCILLLTLIRPISVDHTEDFGLSNDLADDNKQKLSETLESNPKE